jgi:hypothetical protein
MVKYETKYFGTYYLKDEDEEIIIEGKLNINNISREVLVLLSDRIITSDKIENCIKILDGYNKRNDDRKNGMINDFHNKRVLFEYFNNNLNKLDEEILLNKYGL